MTRLKTTQVRGYREELHIKQGGRCAITYYPLSGDRAVLDHDHSTGHVRGVLDRGANALLGKIENNYKRYGMSLPQVIAMCKNIGDYLGKDYSHMPLHPTHKTEDEKRLARNKRARVARAAKKVAL